MEKLLQPLKPEGFGDEIWKSLTNPPDTETDLLSDGEHHPSPQHSPVARGTKRTADDVTKHDWGYLGTEYSRVNVPPPSAAMPIEAGANDIDNDNEEYKPSVYIRSKILYSLSVTFLRCTFGNI